MAYGIKYHNRAALESVEAVLRIYGAISRISQCEVCYYVFLIRMKYSKRENDMRSLIHIIYEIYVVYNNCHNFFGRIHNNCKLFLILNNLSKT